MTSLAIFARIDAAIDGRARADPFSWIKDATDAHRHQHCCWAYPYEDGSVLGAITGVLAPSSVLELGTALGYTSCWWARGGAYVDTIERDPVHVQQARDHIDKARQTGAITVHEGDFAQAVPILPRTYDLAFFDGYEPPRDLLAILSSQLRPNAVVVTTNLDLGGGQFRSVMTNSPGWDTHLIEDLAISIRTRVQR